MSRVTAVVVHWNSGAMLDACLGRIAGREGLDVVVVDNASPDARQATIRAAFPSVHWLPMGRNAGFGAAVNAGARARAGEWILALNPDVSIDAGTVLGMADAAGDLDAAALGPRIVGPDGREELSFGHEDSSVGDFRTFLAWRGGLRPAVPAGPVAVAWVTGACLLLRRREFERVGGFDERYFLYFEDADLCRRLRLSGGRVLFHPGFTAGHVRGHAGRGREAEMRLHYRESQLRFAALHRPALHQRILRTWVGLSAALASAPWRDAATRECGRKLRGLLRAPHSGA